MQIPFVNLKAQYLSIKSEIDTAVQNVIDSTQFIQGKAVEDFEHDFAKAHEMKHCVALGSGTDALHVALWAAGITEGDEVITTPFTFIATAEAISLLGAKPVFADIDAATFTLDPANVERAISKKTKAILPVHLYGQPAAMEQLVEIARRHNVMIIEDAAQAHLAKYNGTYVGNFGMGACFSFYPAKNLGAFGEAGAVLTNDKQFAEKMKRLRDHGSTEKYHHAYIGHNYRMDGIQGAVLGVKLKYLPQWTQRRRDIAHTYKKMLDGIHDLVLPYEQPDVEHVYHLFTILTKKRNALKQFLSEKGIASATHYPFPLHFQPAYAFLKFKRGSFPISEMVAEECLSLPLYPELEDVQVEYVTDCIRTFFKD